MSSVSSTTSSVLSGGGGGGCGGGGGNNSSSSNSSTPTNSPRFMPSSFSSSSSNTTMDSSLPNTSSSASGNHHGRVGSSSRSSTPLRDRNNNNNHSQIQNATSGSSSLEHPRSLQQPSQTGSPQARLVMDQLDMTQLYGNSNNDNNNNSHTNNPSSYVEIVAEQPSSARTSQLTAELQRQQQHFRSVSDPTSLVTTMSISHIQNNLTNNHMSTSGISLQQHQRVPPASPSSGSSQRSYVFVMAENHVKLQKAKLTFGQEHSSKIPSLFNNAELSDFTIILKHSSKLNLSNCLSTSGISEDHAAASEKNEDSSTSAEDNVNVSNVTSCSSVGNNCGSSGNAMLPHCLQNTNQFEEELSVRTMPEKPFVTFTELHVNKAILALYSPFFRKMFFGDMKEKTSSQIEIFDHSVIECEGYDQNVNEIGYEDVRIFCIMIQSMYNLQVECLECDLAPLLETADKYMFGDLVTLCEAYLEKNLNEFNVLSCIFLENSKYQSLKTKASRFIAQKFFIICKNGQLNLIGDIETVLSILSRDDLNVRTEDDILHAALQWIEYDFSSRKKYFPTILNHIRLQYLSPSCLNHLISLPEKYVPDMELTVKLLKKIAKAMSCQLNTIVQKVEKANQQLALHKTQPSLTLVTPLINSKDAKDSKDLLSPNLNTSLPVIQNLEQISVLSPTSIFDSSSEVIGASNNGEDDFISTKPRHHVSGIVTGFDVLMMGKDLKISNDQKTLSKVNTDGWSVNLCVEPVRMGQRKELHIKVNKTMHGIINIGICKCDVNLNGNLNYENGWCYYLYNGHTCHNFHSLNYDGEAGGTNDCFKVQLDLRYNGALSFAKNGQPLGIAFSDLCKKLNGEDDVFYFAVALYSSGDSVSIIKN
ncbi:hypothetical protein C9374_007832 [Naegleria lovaniensis]|uniref:BTB domain-containing protein n=1 Tax=Naegleria lovaniensis TaxID=51637 RepID=A0AA88GFZ8_NAELO|nr:uncharacterized protein C9374_007832 [Naegleria lovaniensis]KAG2378684.1 hypothetical protein C9374_007832 [Naegleria lovaniensis]